MKGRQAERESNRPEFCIIFTEKKQLKNVSFEKNSQTQVFKSEGKKSKHVLGKVRFRGRK